MNAELQRDSGLDGKTYAGFGGLNCPVPGCQFIVGGASGTLHAAVREHVSSKHSEFLAEFDSGSRDADVV